MSDSLGNIISYMYTMNNEEITNSVLGIREGCTFPEALEQVLEDISEKNPLHNIDNIIGLSILIKDSEGKKVGWCRQ